MVEVTFLGVGEAFDEELPNTSILIRSGRGNGAATVLLDCGFTAPPQFWRKQTDVNMLDGIWISHFHGDHCLGLPALLVRFWEEGRDKPFTVLGQKGVGAFIRKALDLAYPGFYGRITFPLRYLEVEPRDKMEIFGLTFQTAENNHSQRDLGLRLDAQGNSIYYSGDGKSTLETTALAKGSQLIIHEAFQMETEIPGHGTVTASIDMARRCGASSLALVHIQRTVRRQMMDRMQRMADLSSPLNVMIPEPGYRVRF